MMAYIYVNYRLYTEKLIQEIFYLLRSIYFFRFLKMQMAAAYPSCKASITFFFITFNKLSTEFVNEKRMDMSNLLK